MERGDRTAARQALEGLPLTESYKASLILASQGSSEKRMAALDQFKRQLTRLAEIRAHEAVRTLRVVFAAALTQVFSYLLYMVAAGWCFTLFIPELPLRTTRDSYVSIE
jgi:hypothetical protein